MITVMLRERVLVALERGRSFLPGLRFHSPRRAFFQFCYGQEYYRIKNWNSTLQLQKTYFLCKFSSFYSSATCKLCKTKTMTRQCLTEMTLSAVQEPREWSQWSRTVLISILRREYSDFRMFYWS